MKENNDFNLFRKLENVYWFIMHFDSLYTSYKFSTLELYVGPFLH